MDNQDPLETRALSAEKRELLALLLEEEGIASSPALTIVPRAHVDALPPLSFAQQRMWLLHQLEPTSAAYNEPEAIRITGPLNVEALERSLNELVRRHDILRTVFPTVAGEPVQVIQDTLHRSLPVVELRPGTAAEQDIQLRQLALAEFQELFDLAQGPLFRVKLLRLAEADYVLLLTMHHMISDGWSFGVFFQDLADLYDALAKDQPTALPELPIQYADFATWQRQSLHEEVRQADLAYWKRQLGRNLPTLELPTDHPRPPIQTYAGARHYLTLSLPLTDALKAMSQQNGVTLFMTLLAAFQTLLYRYTGQEEVLVGSPISGRNWPEVEGLIGCFLNTLALRTDLSGNPRFGDLLGRVREMARGAYAHQDLPFESLVEELQPERELSRSPLYQVMFVLQSPLNPALPGLAVQPLQLDRGASPMDVLLSLEETAQGLRGWWEYNTDLFDTATIVRMTGHLKTLLADVVADPNKRLSDVAVMTDTERHQVLVEWNDRRCPYPRDACIQDLFEAQVETRSDKVAVIEGDVTLTYGQLNRRSNQLAHYLRELGVEPNQPVAVCMGRSADFVVALLGILKAGGVYVPLDPDYPPQRLRFMLDDTQAAAVVTCADWLAALPIEGMPVVRLEADALAIAAQPTTNPEHRNTATDLAYVIYTSGSTGRPKGVEVPHRGVVRLLFGSGYAPLDANQTILLLAPTSFDASTFELWGALLHGGTCVVYPQRVPDAHELEEALTGYGITCLWLTAALFNTVMDQRPQALASVPHLMIGGEALSVRHVRRGLEWLPQTQIVNGYGPTESTTFTCTYPIPRDLAPDARSVPIGRPIGNTRVYIVDRYLNPVPVGVYGDFYIAGDGLARGYLDRPTLTAERFVTDPFSDAPGDRMYKTGDVCRWLPDGTIEFFGRLDHQVKIRGFRIELGEIEAVLGQHAAVQETVVLAREDVPGDRRLVAYIVSHADPPPENQVLRDFLKERLPEYMVPSAFVRLEVLPLTPVGKMDTQALPAPDAVRPDLEQTFVAPRDTLEYQLTKVWEQALGIETVGVQDNFFELGGHSLMAVRVLSQVEEIAHKKLPLVTLFQAPTVEQLAGVLRQSTWEAPWSSLVAIQPAGTKPPFFCVHAAAGNVLFYSDLARYLGTDQPLYGLQARGLDGNEAPSCQVEEMAAHYVDEIRSLQPEGPYFLGGLSFGGTVAFEMAQQLTAHGHEVALLVLFDTCGPGYPQISFPRAIRDKVTHLGGRFRHNIGSFRRKQGQEKGAFALEKVRNVTARSRRRNEKRLDRIREKGERIAYKGYQMSGRPLPPGLRHHAVREADLEAGRSYVHHPYPGRITLFRASNQPAGCRPDPMMGWGDLAGGGMEIHEIPGAHSQHLIREPKIQIVIDKLRACLSEAQEAAAREQV